MSTPTHTADTSLLLSLPAELRNTIYDLVLTTDDDVLCLPNQMGDRTVYHFRVIDPSTSTSSELNHMKFVCRELNVETSNLIPKTPMLVFPDRKDTTECASVICARFFLSAFSYKELHKLNDIHLIERVPYDARAFWSQLFDLRGVGSLVDFCRANPDIGLTVHLRSLNFEDGGYFGSWAKIEAIRLAVHKQPTLDKLPQQVDYHKNIQKMVNRWSGYGLNAPAFPGNLMLTPTGRQGVFRGLNTQEHIAVWKMFRDGI